MLLRINSWLPFGSLPSASHWLFPLANVFSDLLLMTSGLNYKSKPCFWIVSNLIKETKCAIKMTFDEWRYWFWNLLWWYLRLLLTEIFPAFLVACYPCTSLWFNMLLDFYIQTFPQQPGEKISSSSHCLKLSHVVTISSLSSVWAATEWEIRKPQQQSRVLESFRPNSVKVSGKNPCSSMAHPANDAGSSAVCRHIYHLIS